MPPREQYLYQLASLDNELQELGHKVVTSISHAMDALARHEVTMAGWVIADDGTINESRNAFEEHAMAVIATQQPVAGDLRHLMALLDISDELERIGDYAKGIARVVISGADQPPVALPATMVQMADQAREMLVQVLDIIKRRDIGAARHLSAADDQVDALNRRVRGELLDLIKRNPEVSEQAVDLLRVAHNLERMGDRTTNIAERVIFMVSGEIVNLNA